MVVKSACTCTDLKLSTTLRSGFTMLELVFAIVIISIAVLALPTVLMTDAASQEQTLKEEGIMLTTTKIAKVLTFPWDENSSREGTLMSATQVLTTNGDPFLRRNGASDFRIGHFPGELRRRMTPQPPNERNSMGIGGVNNIGAFNGDQEFFGAPGLATGYKKQYRVDTAVAYVSDAAAYNGTTIAFNFNTAPTGISNIKMVTVTTSELTPAGAWDPIVQMTSYASNIGEAEFYKRRY